MRAVKYFGFYGLMFTLIKGLLHQSLTFPMPIDVFDIVFLIAFVLFVYKEDLGWRLFSMAIGLYFFVSIFMQYFVGRYIVFRSPLWILIIIFIILYLIGHFFEKNVDKT